MKARRIGMVEVRRPALARARRAPQLAKPSATKPIAIIAQVESSGIAVCVSSAMSAMTRCPAAVGCAMSQYKY